MHFGIQSLSGFERRPRYVSFASARYALIRFRFNTPRLREYVMGISAGIAQRDNNTRHTRATASVIRPLERRMRKANFEARSTPQAKAGQLALPA